MAFATRVSAVSPVRAGDTTRRGRAGFFASALVLPTALVYRDDEV